MEIWVATFISGDQQNWEEEEMTALAAVTSPFGFAETMEGAKELVSNHIANRIEEEGNPLTLSDWKDEGGYSTAYTLFDEGEDEEAFYGVVKLTR